MNPVAVNRKAKFDYELYDRYEAGVSLLGSEVKSIREGRINLKDSFVRIVRGEVYVFNLYISPYSKIQGYMDLSPTRERKLLLKGSEISHLTGQIARRGFSCVPTAVYFKRGLVKIEIAIAKGKKQFDKRETLKRRIHSRETEAAVKYHTRRRSS